VLFECAPKDNISLDILIITVHDVIQCLSDKDKQVLFIGFQHKQMSKLMLSTVMKGKPTNLEGAN